MQLLHGAGLECARSRPSRGFAFAVEGMWWLQHFPPAVESEDKATEIL